MAQFEACRAEARVDWTYLSPPALLELGTRTGHYRGLARALPMAQLGGGREGPPGWEK